jgi:hypothetical protein
LSKDSDGIVVGIFKEETRAEDAIGLLRNVGFSDDQISYALRKDGSRLDHMRHMLVNMGVPEEEASNYESEFEAGRSIVLVRHDRRWAEALNTFFLNGTRMHRYLNIGNYMSRAVPVSGQNELDDQVVASPRNPYAGNTQVAVRDEMASLHKLLKDAGLDHLL